MEAEVSQPTDRLRSRGEVRLKSSPIIEALDTFGLEAH